MQLASSGGRRLRHAALAVGKLALNTGRRLIRRKIKGAANDLRALLLLMSAVWGRQ
jgi:replication initiation protein RepC